MLSGCFGRNSKRKTEQAVRQVTKQTEKEGQQAGNRKTDFRLLLCAEHGANLTGESPVTGIYRQV